MTVAELELGPHEGFVSSHSTCSLAGKDAIRIRVEILGYVGTYDVVIFLTEKSMGMARASLKLCGFDCDKQDLFELDTNPTLLAGNKVPLMAEEYNNKLRLAIDLNQKIEKGRLAHLSNALRNVKKKRNDDDDAAPVPPNTKPGGNEDYGDIPF